MPSPGMLLRPFPILLIVFCFLASKHAAVDALPRMHLDYPGITSQAECEKACLEMCECRSYSWKDEPNCKLRIRNADAKDDDAEEWNIVRENGCLDFTTKPVKDGREVAGKKKGLGRNKRNNRAQDIEYSIVARVSGSIKAARVEPPNIKPFLENDHAWDLYSWASVNSFLRNRVATLSREEILNGQTPHLFFIKTSVDDTLLSHHERCALESATAIAKRAGTNITIYSNSLPEETLRNLGLENIIVESYDVQELVRGTPLEEWYMGNKETIEGGQNFRQHLSDILRTVLIWKKGGLYLDTDIISMRDDMMEMTNSIGWQKPRFSGILNGAVLKLAAYHPFTYRVMRAMAAQYDPNDYASIGPVILTDVAKELCKLSAIFKHNKCPISCGLEPYNLVNFPQGAFYPITYSGPRLVALYIEKDPAEVEAEMNRMKERGTFALHLWGSRLTRYPAQKGTLLEKIMEQSCPNAHHDLFSEQKPGSDPEFDRRLSFLHPWITKGDAKYKSGGCSCENDDGYSCGFQCEAHLGPQVEFSGKGTLALGPNRNPPQISILRKGCSYDDIDCNAAPPINTTIMDSRDTRRYEWVSDGDCNGTLKWEDFEIDWS